MNKKSFLGNSTIETDRLYNLSDMNWLDETLETGIGDIDGSDPSMKGYNKGWQMEPYKQRYYANKRGENVSRIRRTSAKEVIDISYSSENYANEILSLWKEVDGPLQNFFEAFTMNKVDNKTKKEIAQILRDRGFKVYPVLTDERTVHAYSLFETTKDYQLSDESLTAIENRFNGQADSLNTNYTNGVTMDFGFDNVTQMNSDIGVTPSCYEVRVSRLKKKTITADQIENMPYYEVMDAISNAGRNVSILLNRKLQVAPVFIKQIRQQVDTNAVPKEQNYYNDINVVNIITVHEIWKVFLEYEKTNINECYVVVSGDYTLQGYKNGTWSNIQYCGFYTSVQEAENEISGHLK